MSYFGFPYIDNSHPLYKEGYKRFKTGENFIALRDSIKEIDGSNYKKEYAIFGGSFRYNKETDTLYSTGYGRFVIYEKGIWSNDEKGNNYEIY